MHSLWDVLGRCGSLVVAASRQTILLKAVLLVGLETKVAGL